MYKYGGVYLDTDMLVVKSLDPLGVNWVGKEDDDFISIGAIAADKNGVGHEIIAEILK